jgi:hypothetical protein
MKRAVVLALPFDHPLKRRVKLQVMSLTFYRNFLKAPNIY